MQKNIRKVLNFVIIIVFIAVLAFATFVLGKVWDNESRKITVIVFMTFIVLFANPLMAYLMTKIFIWSAKRKQRNFLTYLKEHGFDLHILSQLTIITHNLMYSFILWNVLNATLTK